MEEQSRDEAMYQTNMVIPKVNLDRNGVQNPEREDIRLAKEAVDSNEK